jgi:hypothetical protein
MSEQEHPNEMAQERAAILDNVRAVPEDELRDLLEAFALENHRLRRMHEAVVERIGESWGLVEVEPLGDRGVSIVVCAPGFDEVALLERLREEISKAFGTTRKSSVRLVGVIPSTKTPPVDG